jgi:hypothetical protein
VGACVATLSRVIACVARVRLNWIAVITSSLFIHAILLGRVAELAGEGVCMALVQLGLFGAANITLCLSGSLAGRRLLAGAARVVADVADRADVCVVSAVALSRNRLIQALWSSPPAW